MQLVTRVPGRKSMQPENMQPVKRGKTCNQYQARENIQPVSIAGKHETGTKRGKTCNRCQSRENMQPVSSAGKHATGMKRKKNCNRTQAQENGKKLGRGTIRVFSSL